jgi:hypothetical protein
VVEVNCSGTPIELSPPAKKAQISIHAALMAKKIAPSVSKAIKKPSKCNNVEEMKESKEARQEKGVHLLRDILIEEHVRLSQIDVTDAIFPPGTVTEPWALKSCMEILQLCWREMMRQKNIWQL